MSCSGINGLLHALEVFAEGKAANSLNELSKALSKAVGKPVKLHTSMDMDQIKNAVQSIHDQLGMIFFYEYFFPQDFHYWWVAGTFRKLLDELNINFQTAKK
jgi:hypothetical protein